jgi:acyl transferase domain-containing protein/acyl carrier protein
MKTKAPHKNTSKKNSVAIVGMAGVFPESDSIQEFWEKLENQECFVREIPEDHDPKISAQPKRGAFVKNLRGFDAGLFHIVGKEAQYMTPQQRVLMMSVWNLFEDACILPSSLKDKKVAVIVGKEVNPYMEYLTKAPITAYSCLGMAQTYLPNRISNYFNLKGPSYCINTSCSSGLTALHHGKKLLQNGDADYVIAAGVSLIYGEEWTRSFFGGSQSMGLMSTTVDGGKPFQGDASGFTPSEGVITFLMKRSDEAIADNDNIHAHVIGSESSHVGGNGNIAFPDATQQSQAIVAAYEEAEIPPATVTYVEAHAASAILADSQEMKAFKRADKTFGESVNKDVAEPCKISSLKPNIGHMHAASGLASVVRLIYSFKAQKKLGIKGFTETSKEINLDKTRYYISSETEEWNRLKDDKGNEIPRRGAVNNSGGGGNVIHVLFEESSSEATQNETQKEAGEIYYLPLSCQSESQFIPYAKSIKEFLEKNEYFEEKHLEYHYLTSRKELNCRMVFRYKSIQDLIQKLTKFVDSDGKRGYYVNGNHKEELSLNEIFLKNGKVVEFLNELSDKRDKSILFDLWSKGYEAPVHKYFADVSYTKISLPGYPFKLQSYWLDIYADKTQKQELDLAKETPITKEINAPVAIQISDDNLQSEVETFLTQTVADSLAVSTENISTQEEIGDFGFNSVGLMELANVLGEHYQMSILPTLFYSYPTIEKLAQHFIENHVENVRKKHNTAVQISEKAAQPVVVAAPEKPKKKGCKKATCKAFQSTLKRSEPIAIIGMSGRFPGSPNVNTFWENIKANKDLITEIPEDRWSWQEHFGNTKDDPRKTGAKWGGFIKDIDKFDPLHFSISPKEAELMDPQHRIAIEEAYHALEDAGINPKSLSGTNTGVFVGSYFDDYATLIDRNAIVDSQIITGLSQSLVANRISYLFDITGPSETIDTACSSSLIAIKRGVERIRNGECDMVIAGGVSLVLMPDLLFPLSQAGFLSKDGRCKTFDQSADGYVRGEGVGMIVMKSLSQAEADGDRIYAVIKSASENHGGKANTLTSPNPQAQRALLNKAYSDANIDLDQVGYIEAHGTGTPLGDPIETEGLKLAFNDLYKQQGEMLPSSSQIKLGSVKTNIGHLEPAAGVAGIIKLVKVLQDKIIPGNPHLKEKNEFLDLSNSPFELQRETTPWNTIHAKPRVAGISSFGAGGSNAHVVLEEYVATKESYQNSQEALVLLSGKNNKRLKDQVHNLLTFVEGNPEVNIHDLAYTLQVGREAMEERFAVLVKDVTELKDKLNAYLSEKLEGIFTGNTRKNKKASNNKQGIQTALETYNLAQLTEFWIEGAKIDWKLLYQDQLPTVISLPTYPFARQRYWLRETEGRAVIAPKKTVQTNKQIELYQDAWKAVELAKQELSEGAYLLLNSEGKDEELVTQLQSEISNITIANADQISSIAFESVVGIIDLGATSATDYSWTKIVQETIDKSSKATLHFVHISETGTTSIGKGLYQTLGAEYGKVSSTALELTENTSASDAIEAIITALSNTINNVRLKVEKGTYKVPVLSKINLTTEAKVEGPILITGGTRGLGMAYAKHLAEAQKVSQLILLGRQEFPARETWKDYENQDSTLAQKIKDVLYLESLGATVKLIVPSLTNKEELAQSLSAIKSEWGAIRGLVHCAGLVDRDTPAFIRKSTETIQALQDPKILGLHNLYDVLKEHQLDFGILFSSISALVPHLGAGQCDYAMCNGYLDSFAAIHYQEGYRSIQWPSWKETGMGEVTDGIYRDLGLLSLTNKEGAKIIDQVIALKPEDRIPTIAPMVFDAAVFNVENLLEIPEKEAVEIKVTVSTASNASITDWVRLQISEALRLPQDIIEMDVPFQEYGVDSILLADLVKQLEKQLGNNVSLSPSIILEHPTIGMLSEYFTENHSSLLSEILNEEIVAEPKVTESTPKEPVQETTQVIKVIEKAVMNEPIAVIGMACHFPDANNIGEFWNNLVEGKDSIKDIPEGRWDTEEFYAPEKTPGKSYIKWGGFLDSIEDFDPKYFKIPEALAVQTDPLERQWLEVSAEAIQDAGYEKKQLSGKQVGVYAGSRVGNFKQKLTDLHKDFIVGTGQNFITAHLAHIYNLKGPNLVVDTACSSSLTAIDLAVKDLRLGVTEMALAGGVDILLDEGHFVGMSTAEVLSKDGRTKAFDEKADGTGLGEGCGVIVLKKLSDAIESGDKIYCVIEGTSVNNDGSTMGITTPNPKAQQALIESAIENGDVDRSTISYVEAHGTGTLVGDPIELKGITAVLAKNNDQGIKCAVGSVKTNIGHLMSASGIAGVIKVALSISAKQLPPTLNCDTPNPRFDFDNSPVFPIRELQDWNGVSGIRRAGISAFGLGGNNAHVILSNEGIPQQNSVHTPFNNTNIPFDKKRYWPEEKVAPKAASVKVAPAKPKAAVSTISTANPASEKSMANYFNISKTREGAEWVFSMNLENDHYILRDHKVHGVRIVPGVTYLDLIIRCSKQLFKTVLEISRIVFVEPLATDETYDRFVQVRFKKGKHSVSEVEVRSRRMDHHGNLYGDWSKHMFCRLHKMTKTPTQTMNIDGFKVSADRQLNMSEVYASARTVDIVHGEFMETLGMVYQKGREELMELHLSDLSNSYMDRFFISPAFLDGATFSGSSFHAITQNQISYIPYSIEQFNAYKPLPSTIYVYSKHKHEKYDTPSEIIKSDIYIYDEKGTLLVEFKNLAIKKIRHEGLITSLLQSNEELVKV